MGNKQNFIKKFSIMVVLLIMIAFFGVLRTDAFLTVNNMFTVLRQSSIMGIATIGLLFVMLTGGIDLSIGSMVSFTSVLASVCIMNLGLGIVPAYCISIAAGTLIGLISGMIIVKTGIFPMIGTLALQIILQGAAYLVCGGMPVYGLPDGAKIIGQGYVGPVPIPVIIFVVIIIIAAVVLNTTYMGRHFYAVGSNTEAARLSGLNTGKIKVLTYALSGFLASLAGMIMLGRVSSGQPTAGKNMEMDCLTAAVIGGVSLNGGEGKISQVVTGVLIIGVLSNGMTIMDISEYYQLVIRGTIFLCAVCFDGIQKHWSIGKKKKVA